MYDWPGSSVGCPWNQPRGSLAVIKSAGLRARTGKWITFVDYNPLFMDPTQPLVGVQKNGGQNADRCTGDGTVLVNMRLNPAFVLPSSGHNDEFAGLGSDGLQLIEGGNMGRCVAGGLATAGHAGIYGVLTDTLITGASGGSGLSTIGGAIRLGDWASKVIRHALRINLCASTDYSPKNGPSNLPFLWPADRADGYALDLSDPRHYAGTVEGVCPGALIILPPSVNIGHLGLNSEPGEIFATCMQDYGGYPANDAVQSTFAFTCELGLSDDAASEFERTFGFPMAAQSGDWADDVQKIIPELGVIINNSVTALGGGGTPCQPLAPPFS